MSPLTIANRANALRFTAFRFEARAKARLAGRNIAGAVRSQRAARRCHRLANDLLRAA